MQLKISNLNESENNYVSWCLEQDIVISRGALTKFITNHILYAIRTSGESIDWCKHSFTEYSKLPCKTITNKHGFILRYGNTEGELRYKLKCEKSLQNLDSFTKRYGIENGPVKYKQYCISKGHSLLGYITRYGEVDGPIKHKLYWETTNFSTSKAAFIRRHGDEIGGIKHTERSKRVSDWAKGIGIDEDEFNARNKRKSDSQKALTHSRDNLSCESFQKRYGIVEGKQRYIQYCIKSREYNPLCYEYYYVKGFTELEAKQAVHEEQCRRNSTTIGHASKESLKIFIPIYKLLRKKGIARDDIMLGVSGSREFRIKTKENLFLYDFYIKPLNLIIEYNGLYWHIKEKDGIIINRNMHLKKDDEEIKKMLDRDKLKISNANSKGIDVLTIWSDSKIEDNIKFVSDYIKNKMEHNNE